MCPWWLLAAEAWWKSTEVCVLLPWLLRVAWMSCLGVVHVPLTSVNTGAETQAESSLPLMLLLLWPPPVSGSACALETQRRTDTEGREGAISDRRVASPEPGLQKKNLNKQELDAVARRRRLCSGPWKALVSPAQTHHLLTERAAGGHADNSLEWLLTRMVKCY